MKSYRNWASCCLGIFMGFNRFLIFYNKQFFRRNWYLTSYPILLLSLYSQPLTHKIEKREHTNRSYGYFFNEHHQMDVLWVHNFVVICLLFLSLTAEIISWHFYPSLIALYSPPFIRLVFSVILLFWSHDHQGVSGYFSFNWGWRSVCYYIRT